MVLHLEEGKNRNQLPYTYTSEHQWIVLTPTPAYAYPFDSDELGHRVEPFHDKQLLADGGTQILGSVERTPHNAHTLTSFGSGDLLGGRKTPVLRG